MAVYWVLVDRSQTVTKNLNLFNELSILLPISSETLHSNYWKTGCFFRNSTLSRLFCQGSASQTCQRCDKWLKYYTFQILCLWLFLYKTNNWQEASKKRKSFLQKSVNQSKSASNSSTVSSLTSAKRYSQTQGFKTLKEWITIRFSKVWNLGLGQKSTLQTGFFLSS